MASADLRSGDRWVVRIQRTHQIIVALRRIELPQRAEFGDRRIAPIDRRSISGKLSRSTTSRCALRTGTGSPPAARPASSACHQSLRQWSGRIGLERAQHRGRDRRARQDIADRTGVLRRRRVQFRLDPYAAESRGVAGRIQHGKLPPMRMRCGGDEGVHGLLRRAAGAQQRDATWPKPRIGAMLRQNRANASGAIGAARADGDRGCGHGSADLSGTGATADEREGHGSLMSRSVELSMPGTAASLDDGRKACGSRFYPARRVGDPAQQRVAPDKDRPEPR